MAEKWETKRAIFAATKKVGYRSDAFIGEPTTKQRELKMMKIISAASILLLTFMVAGTPAKVQQPQSPSPRNFNFTGATLQASCVYEDKREKNQMNLLNSTTTTFEAMGVCQGFIMGVAMSDIDAGYVVITGPPTPEATVNAVVIEYMKEHPEKLNQSALTVVRNALEQAYPTPAQNSNQQQ